MSENSLDKSSRSDKIQILRAMAIIAVIMIHTCTYGIKQVWICPFINFAVPMFLFFSAYLTKIEEIDVITFYKKIIRALVPYLIWTMIYSIVHGDIKGIPYNIITTKASYAFYYIFVYIGFVLITPLLAKIYTGNVYIKKGDMACFTFNYNCFCVYTLTV